MASDSTKIVEATGLPVNEFYKRSGASQLTDQVKGPELGHLIRCLATDPNVKTFGWQQYTPYFNDGDVCEFRVGELWILTVDDSEDEEDFDRYSYEVSDTHPTLGPKKWIMGVRVPAANGYGYTYTPSSYEPKEAKYPTTYLLAESLSKALEHAEVTLLEWFGDHVEIRVTKDGIQVDEYEHD